MIRLVVSDVDGTLVKDGTCDINPEYYDVIRALTAAGIRVAIASGRQEDSIRKVFLPVEEKLIFISNDGACVSEGDKQIFSVEMPTSPIKWMTPSILSRFTATPKPRANASSVRSAATISSFVPHGFIPPRGKTL